MHCSCGNTFTTRSTVPDAARRALQRVPPLLHGQAEAGRHRWPRRALRAPLRQAQGRPRRSSAEPSSPVPSALWRRDRQRARSWYADQARRARRAGASGASRRPARSPAARRVRRRRRRRWVCSASDPAPRRSGRRWSWADRRGRRRAPRARRRRDAAGVARPAGRALRRPPAGVAGRRTRPRCRSRPTAAAGAAASVARAGRGLVDLILDAGARAGRRARRAHAARSRGLEVLRAVVDPDDGRRPARGRRRPPRPRGYPGPRRRAARRRARRGGRHRRARTAGRAPRPTRCNRLAPERWLRADCSPTRRWSAAPSLARSQRRRSPDDLQRRLAPRSPSASTRDGRPVVVVCSVGIDLDVVPAPPTPGSPSIPRARLRARRPRARRAPGHRRAGATRSVDPPRSCRARRLAPVAGGLVRARTPAPRPRATSSPTSRRAWPTPPCSPTSTRLRASSPSGTRSSSAIVSRVPRATAGARRPRGRPGDARPRPTGDDREVDAGRGRPRPRPTIERLDDELQRPAAARRTRTTSKQRHRRDPRRRGRRGGQPLRPRPVRDVPGATPARRAGSSRCSASDPSDMGGFNEVTFLLKGDGVWTPHEARGRAAPGAAGAGHREPGPHPHVVGDRHRAARGRGGRRRRSTRTTCRSTCTGRRARAGSR